MATSVLSSTFNAFAFAGAGWIFSRINRGDYDAEMKRHNRAMETLTRERDKWNEARSRELDRIANLHYDKSEGLKDIYATNKDFALIKTKFDSSKPKLSDYYKPSSDMVDYMNLVKLGTIVTSAVSVGLLVL